jgi:hypothetical protein
LKATWSPRATTSSNATVISISPDLAVRTEWLEKADKTDPRLPARRPVLTWSSTVRDARAAWSYEAPLPDEAGRQPFRVLKDVEVG